MTKASVGGVRIRLALALALTLLGSLALAGTASAFAQFGSIDGRSTPGGLGSMTPERMAINTVATSPNYGNLYVIDTAANAVDVFNRYGKYLSQVTVPSTAPSAGTFGFDGFEDSIAIDNSSNAATQGNIYVDGEGNGAAWLSAFHPDGTFMWQTKNLAFPNPPHEMSGVAVNPTNGDVWIADRFGGMARVNAADGTPRGDTPVGPGDQNAHMDFDANGNMYAAPSQGGVNRYLAPVLGQTGTTVDPLGSFDIGVDQTNGDVYVDHSSFINVFNSCATTCVPDPNTGFGTSSSGYAGLAVNGAIDRVYLANKDTNNVDLWSRNAPTLVALTVTVAGAGKGTVDADHGPVLGCGGTTNPVCTGNYEQNDPSVTLHATATSGVFAGWSGPDAGACASTTTDCTLSMSAAKSVTATFDAGPPVVTTGAATSVTQTGATLHGTVNPDGGNVTSCQIQYGTSTSYGSQAACSPASVGGGGSPVNVSAAVSGLSAGTTYHYRVVATNSFGTTNGNDGTLQTQATPTCATDASLCPPPPPPPTCANTPSLCPPPPPPPPPPAQTCATNPSLCAPPPATMSVLHGGSFKVSKSGKVTVSLSCSAGHCGGTVVLKLTVKAKHGHKTVTRTITAATASVSIAAGKSVTVVLRLSGAAKAALAKSHSLQGTLTAGGLHLSARVTVRR